MAKNKIKEKKHPGWHKFFGTVLFTLPTEYQSEKYLQGIGGQQHIHFTLCRICEKLLSTDATSTFSLTPPTSK